MSGGILGSFAEGKYSSKLKLPQWVVVALSGSGFAVTGLGLIVSRISAVGFLVAFAGVLALLNIPFVTSLELLAPDEIRGRVIQSAFLLIGGITSPMGLVMGGWLMTTLGVRTVLLPSGSCSFALLVLGHKYERLKKIGPCRPDLTGIRKTLRRRLLG